jgi:hypothetical protein
MGTVVGSWRLKLILILVIFSSLMYTANAMFSNLGGNVNSDGYITYTANTTNIGYNQTDIGSQKSQNFVDVLMGIGDFLTFAVIKNDWARLVLSSIMGLCWLTIGYIIFTFIKEWIPLV